MKNQGVARFFLCLALLLLYCSPARAARDVSVTSPWLTLMARFVGGVQVRVHPLSSWNEQGRVIRNFRPSSHFPIIAMDKTEASLYRVKGSSVKLLFETLPGGSSVREAAFLDPSSLAFIGQRLLGALSSIDPQNYAYYQRRLAEFQSRTDTTVGVGRKLLEKMVILDLTGAAGKWISAATDAPIRPPDHVMALWKEGKSLETLAIALQEASKNGWILVIDPWTPQTVIEKTRNMPHVASLPAPSLEKEMLTILHDLYLSIWNASGNRPNPRKP